MPREVWKIGRKDYNSFFLIFLKKRQDDIIVPVVTLNTKYFASKINKIILRDKLIRILWDVINAYNS